MAILHPALLATAGGLALLPLIIHLLSRRGYQTQPWAAMMFLDSATQATRRRLRVERWLLLVVRTLIVILLGLAIARPLASGSLLSDALARPRFDRVIVIDDSLSMRAVHPDGSTSFDAAKSLARRMIDECEARDGLALVAASSAPRSWMDQPMHDRQALRSILDGWNCSWATNDIPGALRLASELLARGQAVPGCRLVYLISDRTRSTMASDDATSGSVPDGEWPGIDRIFVLDVGPLARDNVAVTDLSAASQIIGAGVPARFHVRISNQGTRRVEQVSCDMLLDGAVVQSRAVGPIESRGEVSEAFELDFNHEGPHRVSAQIRRDTGDTLPDDDTRYLGVQVASGLSVLGVEGSDDPRRAARELFYFSVAVSSPSTRSSMSSIRVKTVNPIDLEREILGDYSVVVLGNVRRLPEEQWTRIDRFVRAGGGLVLVLGDRVQGDHYHETSSSFEGLIPFDLGEAAAVAEPAEPWRLQIVEPRHLALADLVGSDRGGLRVAQIRAYWKCAPRSAARSLYAPIRVSNGDPLLIESEVGHGRVLAWLTSANMAWNNLPAKPDYVPLLLNLTLYAAGCDRNARAVLVGQPIVHTKDRSGAHSVGVVQRPDGPSVDVDWTSTLGISTFVYQETNHPGFYRVTTGHDQFMDAVNIDSRESDLSTADETVLRQRLGTTAKTVATPGDVVAELSLKPPRELAPFFMVLLLVLVATETIVATLFGGRS